MLNLLKVKVIAKTSICVFLIALIVSSCGKKYEQVETEPETTVQESTEKPVIVINTSSIDVTAINDVILAAEPYTNTSNYIDENGNYIVDYNIDSVDLDAWNPENETTTSKSNEETIRETEEETTVVSHDDTPYNEALEQHFSKEFQKYIWNLCKSHNFETSEELNKYYASMIGLAEGESTWDKNETHHNSNGSTDRGLWQINSCNVKEFKSLGWINSSDDLYDPYVSAKCADYIWYKCWVKKGYQENTYSYYLYGREHSNNKYTSRMWGFITTWYDVLF